MAKIITFLNQNISIENQKKLVNISKILLVFIFCYICIRLYFKNTNLLKDWTFSDWLVNYNDGGFKRRGLGGSVILFVEKITHIKIEYIILFIEYFFYGYIYKKIIDSFSLKKIDIYFISLLFLPFCMAFNLIEVSCLGRKDIILISIAIFQVIEKEFKYKSILLYFFLIIGIFLHEMTFFYLPFYIAYDYIKNRKTNYLLYSSLIITSTIIMIVIYFYGSKINEGNSLNILSQKGIFFEKMNFFDYNESVKEINHIKTNSISYILMFLEFLLSLSYIIYYVKKYYQEHFKTILIFIIISFTFTLPLYYLAIDWFRWMYIYCILLFLIIFLFLDENTQNNKIVINQNNIKRKYLIIPIILFFMLLLHMQNDFIFEIISPYIKLNIKRIDFGI